MNQILTDEEIRQQAQDSFDNSPANCSDLPIPYLQGVIQQLTAERDSLNNMLDAVAKVASEAEKLVISQREKIETLHRHIADIGEAMRTKANNNPDGVKSSTLEMLGEELLAALPSNA